MEMAEEIKYPPTGGKALNDDELEQVNGGALSDDELYAFLDAIEDDDLQHAWAEAIAFLYNYKGWSYSRYAEIADYMADFGINECKVNLSHSEFKKIMLQAYKQFFNKIHTP